MNIQRTQSHIKQLGLHGFGYKDGNFRRGRMVLAYMPISMKSGSDLCNIYIMYYVHDVNNL